MNIIIFYVHFLVLNQAGPGNSFVSLPFRNSLQVLASGWVWLVASWWVWLVASWWVWLVASWWVWLVASWWVWLEASWWVWLVSVSGCVVIVSKGH